MSDPLDEQHGTPDPGEQQGPGDRGQTSKSGPERLPDDHPLVTALAAQKTKNADLARQLDELKTATAAQDGDLAGQLATLQQQVEEEKRARAAAETSAMRTRMAAGKLPSALISKLTGTTEDEIAAEIAELEPHLKPPGGGKKADTKFGDGRLRSGSTGTGADTDPKAAAAEALRSLRHQ